MNVNEFDYIATPSDREALKLGYVFDPVKADRPVRFIERLCKLSVGEFAGQPLALLDWQKEMCWRAFGWVDSDGVRRHRELFLTVPKKNGKTELASALALYMLMGDGEACAKVALAATTRQQASMLWTNADRMAAASPFLSSKLESSEFHKRIRSPDGGEIVTNSSDAPSQDGGNLSAVICDELHLWTGAQGRKAWNVYSGSGAARRQPLKISISTAGNSVDSVMHEQWTRACKVESGELVDPYLCAVVYGPRPREELDPHDETTWHRCNPSLGRTMTLPGFKADYEASRHAPSSFDDWKQRRLNFWVQKTGRFIDMAAWAVSPPKRSPAEILESGDPCFAGADLSDCRDLTAATFLTGAIETGFDVDT